jgi:outer membrane protein assembly factor BamA
MKVETKNRANKTARVAAGGSLALLAVVCVLAASSLLAAGPATEGDTGQFEGRVIDDIRISGAKHTKQHIIERELASKPGEPLSQKNLTEDAANLDALGVFSDINVRPVEEDGKLILAIDVKETFRYLPVVALKIDDENGISIGGGLKSVNLFGRAMYFSGTVLFGGATTVVLQLRDAWVVGNRIGYDLQYFHRDRRNELFEFDEVADEIFLILYGPLGKYGKTGITSSYQYLKSDTDGKTLDPDNRDNMLSVGLFLGYDSRDLKSNPHNGWDSYIDVSRVWSMDTDTARWLGNIDLRRYQSISGPHILGLFSMLTMTSGDVGVNIAEWQQYSLGGSNSVRGWDIGRLSGKNQFINTLEYRFNILEPRSFSVFGINARLGVQLAAFGDVGAVWSESEDFSNSFIGGGGAGLRLIIPYVGLGRIDFGWGGSGVGVQVHLGAGEKAERARSRVR